jgi:hypothetical protein
VISNAGLLAGIIPYCGGRQNKEKTVIKMIKNDIWFLLHRCVSEIVTG